MHTLQIITNLAIFEALRKLRAQELQRRSHDMREVYEMVGGLEQVEYDRLLVRDGAIEGC